MYASYEAQFAIGIVLIMLGYFLHYTIARIRSEEEWDHGYIDGLKGIHTSSKPTAYYNQGHKVGTIIRIDNERVKKSIEESK